MYQQITIVGNLGRDPEARFLPNGDPVTSFSVATGRTWTDTNGQKQERTVWFRVSVFGNQAGPCSKYLAKGRQVLVIGEMQEPRPYQGKDGEWRASLDVRARSVQFLGSAGDSQAPQQRQAPQAPQAPQQADDTESIPF